MSVSPNFWDFFKPEPIKNLDIPIVEWNSHDRDERGVPLISTEIWDGRYYMLYADGTVSIRDYLNRKLGEEKVDFDKLKEKVKKYKNNEIKMISASDFLQIVKTGTENE